MDRGAWGCQELESTETTRHAPQPFVGFPAGSDGKESAFRAADPWAGKIPWRREWPPSPVFLPGESYRQRNMDRVHGITKSQTYRETDTHAHAHTGATYWNVLSQFSTGLVFSLKSQWSLEISTLHYCQHFCCLMEISLIIAFVCQLERCFGKRLMFTSLNFQ